jgi:hypothetical protein
VHKVLKVPKVVVVLKEHKAHRVLREVVVLKEHKVLQVLKVRLVLRAHRVLKEHKVLRVSVRAVQLDIWQDSLVLLHLAIL